VLLIILAIATVAGFGSATVVEMQATSTLQSWQEVGARYRIDATSDELRGFSVPDALTSASLPGVTATVPAHLTTIAMSTGGQRQLVAIDLAAYARMLAGSPVALSLPASMLAAGPAGGDAAGTATSPLPAVVSSGSSGPFEAPKVGTTFQLSFSSRPVTFVTVAQVEAFPGLPAGQPLVIASWPQINAVAPDRLRGTTTIFVDAPVAAAPALVAAVHAAAPQAVVIDRADRNAALAGQGVVEIVALGVIALAAIAALYAALAVMAAFVLTASARADEAAHLGTLGLSDRQSAWMLVVEFGPPVALAVLAGALLGLGLFTFLGPGLGLTTIVGALQAAPPGLDPVQLALLAGVVAAILAIGVGLGGVAQRRGAQAAVRRGLQ
jgi:putative ABC transport system permease protein